MTLYALGAHQPQLHIDTWVAPDANLIGQVVLEAGASVWFGCTLRADHEEIRICEGSNVQENVVMHIDAGYPLTVGKNCTIGHKVMLHGCTIHDRVLVGMGATVMDGAVVESDVIIGAGSLVPPGKKLESGYLYVGSPVKQARALNDDEKSFFLYSAKKYRELKDRYLSASKIP